MDDYELRRRRLRELMVTRFEGKQVNLANGIDCAPDYISRVFSGKKQLGEDLARKIEDKLRLPKGWLTASEEPPPPIRPWPFSFPRTAYERLSDAQQKSIDATIRSMMEAFDMPLAQTAKKRRA